MKKQIIDPNCVNKNQEIVSKYVGEWIAINNQKGIIGHHSSLIKLKQFCDAMNVSYIFYSVPKYFGKVRILPIIFKKL